MRRFLNVFIQILGVILLFIYINNESLHTMIAGGILLITGKIGELTDQLIEDKRR